MCLVFGCGALHTDDVLGGLVCVCKLWCLRSIREGTTSPAVEQVYSFAESHSPNRIYAIAATVQYF